MKRPKKTNKQQLKVKRFKARDTRAMSNEQAQIYGERIDYLMSVTGKVTTDIVLSDAKQPASPLHDFFEWDNKKASEKYRKHQANLLLSNIIEVKYVEDEEIEYRGFFAVKEEKTNEPIFVDLDTATSNKTYRQELIGKMLRHIQNTKDLLQLFRDNDY